MPMNLPNTPQLVATDCFSGNAFAPNENLVHLLFQMLQIYSYSNGNKAVWMPKSIALQNMTALQANSGLILFTSKLTEFLQNSIFTYSSKIFQAMFSSFQQQTQQWYPLNYITTLCAWYSGLPLIRKLKIPWLSLNFKQFSLTFY